MKKFLYFVLYVALLVVTYMLFVAFREAPHGWWLTVWFVAALATHDLSNIFWNRVWPK